MQFDFQRDLEVQMEIKNLWYLKMCQKKDLIGIFGLNI